MSPPPLSLVHVAAYETAFAEFAQRIAALPRISCAPAGQRKARLGDHLPLSLITLVFSRMLWR